MLQVQKQPIKYYYCSTRGFTAFQEGILTLGKTGYIFYSLILKSLKTFYWTNDMLCSCEGGGFCPGNLVLSFPPTKQADSSSFLCVYEPLVGCKTVKLVIGFGNVRLGRHPGGPLRKTRNYSRWGKSRECRLYHNCMQNNFAWTNTLLKNLEKFPDI